MRELTPLLYPPPSNPNNSTQLNSTQLNSTQLNSTQLNSTQLNSTQQLWVHLLIETKLTYLQHLHGHLRGGSGGGQNSCHGDGGRGLSGKAELGAVGLLLGFTTLLVARLLSHQLLPHQHPPRDGGAQRRVLRG